MIQRMDDGGAPINAQVPERFQAAWEEPHPRWQQHVGGNGRVTVHVAEDSDLARADAPARETFESVWKQRHVTRERETFRFVDDRFFLKCRRVPSWGDVEAVRESGRVVSEARFLERIRAAGIRVPATLAWGEERCFGVSVRSFLLTRAVRGACNLSEFVGKPDAEGPDRASVFKRVGDLVWRLHAAGLYHRDLSTRNLLVSEEGSVLAIDCPRGFESRFGSRRAALRRGDLLRLGRSLLRDGATEAELGCVLESAGVDRPDALLAAVVRRLAEGRRHSWRTRLWLMTGA